ncbi:MAG: hypothetical protein ACREVR_13510 [Burkholderiales bacterium]
MKVKPGFTPIALHDYVKLHLRANPGAKRADVIARLEDAIDAFRRDIRCRCGAPIWIIGSAEVGLACFTCITGEAMPDHDYEIEVKASRSRG